MSILSHLHQNPQSLPPQLDLLYTHRRPSKPPEKEGATTDSDAAAESVLFLKRLESLFASKPFPQGPNNQNPYKFAVFLTPPTQFEAREGESKASEYRTEVAEQQWRELIGIRSIGVLVDSRRISRADLLSSVEMMNEQERRGIVAYVCGPPSI